jgi:hypothetical protein
MKTILDICGHLYEPLDWVAVDLLGQLIADAIADRTRTELGLERSAGDPETTSSPWGARGA